MPHDTDARRTRLYKWAIGLSIIYVADGIFESPRNSRRLFYLRTSSASSEWLV